MNEKLSSFFDFPLDRDKIYQSPSLRKFYKNDFKNNQNWNAQEHSDHTPDLIADAKCNDNDKGLKV